MFSPSITGELEYKGAVKVAMVARIARLRKPLCESKMLEMISDTCTVVAMDSSMEPAVP
jgi:hypothetical protein